MTATLIHLQPNPVGFVFEYDPVELATACEMVSTWLAGEMEQPKQPRARLSMSQDERWRLLAQLQFLAAAFRDVSGGVP
jgi:hypothetical protein